MTTSFKYYNLFLHISKSDSASVFDLWQVFDRFDTFET